MSFSTIRLSKSQLPAACAHCGEGFEPEWSLLNLGRRGNDKQATVVAHRVRDAYHGFSHPKCFKDAVQTRQAEGNHPQCFECRVDVEKVDGRSIVDPSATIDNSSKGMDDRGQLLRSTLSSDLAFSRDLYGRRDSMQNAVRRVLSTGEVFAQDRCAAAVAAGEHGHFDCIPILIHNGELTAYAIDRVFDLAMAQGHFATMKALLPLGVYEDRQVRALHLMASAWTCDLETLMVLLRQRRAEGRTFDSKTLDAAIAAATRSDCHALEKVRALLEFGGITAKGCMKAIEEAAKGSNAEVDRTREIIHLLLAKAELSGYAKSAAMMKALIKFRFALARDIGTSGPISGLFHRTLI